MIVTVTLNPAMDKTAEVSSFTPGGLNRLENIVLDPGGKGINVSKMIAALNGSSVATGFLGGSSGKDIAAMLNEMKIDTDFVNVAQPTRINLKVFSKDFGITEFNEPGATVTQAEDEEFREKLLSYAKSDTIFVFSGSMPKNAGADTYAVLIDLVKAKGASVFLDADGAAFKEALSVKPDYIKPNIYELKQYFNISGDLDIKECATRCKSLIEEGVRVVALSMGGDGALFVSKKEALFSPALDVDVRSTVGAGDSMVGALVYAFDRGLNLREAARLAMAASAGAVTTEGTKPPDNETVYKLLNTVEFFFI